MDLTERYSPPFAPRVEGRYEKRVGTEPQRYAIECSACGETFGPAICDSGRVRDRIAKFAVLHLHADVSSHR